MAGLLIALGRRPGWAPAVVGRLAPALAHYPWLRARMIEADPLALALVLHEDVEPPVWKAEGAQRVVVFGEYVHDAGGRVAAELAAHASAGRWDALRNGNGLYNLAVWDDGRRRLVLANDATGSLLLFRAAYPDGWIWCSEPGALPPAGGIDAAGLRSLAGIGYQADGRTLDTGISVMPAATTDVVELVGGLAGGRIRHERHTGFPGPGSRPASFEATYSDLLRDAVRRRLPGDVPVELALTGGLDSRLLLARTQALGARVRTFTLASGDPWDVRLARRLAGVTGVEHRILPIEPGTVRRNRPLLSGALHTTSDWHVAQQLAICGAARPGQPLMLGFLGGTVAGAFVDGGSAEAGTARLRAFAMAPYVGGIDARHIAWCEPPGGTDPGVTHELVENLYGRQRRYTSYMVRLAWNFGRPIAPFADVRLVRLALAARREELAGQRVRVRSLRRSNPGLARIATPDDAVGVGPAIPRLLRTAVRRSRVMQPVRALVPVPLGFDYGRLRPLADECRDLVPEEAGRRLLAGLSPMGTLALAPVLMDGGDEAVDLVESLLGGR